MAFFLASKKSIKPLRGRIGGMRPSCAGKRGDSMQDFKKKKSSIGKCKLEMPVCRLYPIRIVYIVHARNLKP